MNRDLIAIVSAALAPSSHPAAPPPDPAEPQDPNTPHRRGRPPKKPDEAYRAARAAITGDDITVKGITAKGITGKGFVGKDTDSARCAPTPLPAAVAPPTSTSSTSPATGRCARRQYQRKTFRPLPAAEKGKPVDLEAAKAILQPRDGLRRAWPPTPVGPKSPPPRLSPEEMQQVITFYLERFGPILSLDEAAEVAKLSKQTLRRFVSEGCFANAVYRGRPLRFLTQRFIGEVLV